MDRDKLRMIMTAAFYVGAFEARGEINPAWRSEEGLLHIIEGLVDEFIEAHPFGYIFDFWIEKRIKEICAE